MKQDALQYRSSGTAKHQKLLSWKGHPHAPVQVAPDQKRTRKTKQLDRTEAIRYNSFYLDQE